MNMKVMVKLEIFDKSGKVVKTIEKESESWCRGYGAQMLAQFRGASTASPTAPDTGNTSRTLRTSAAPFRCSGSLGVVTHGIRVGTSSQAVDMTDYAMIVAIAEGTGSGEMEHQATSISNSSVAGSTASFTVARTIVNNSGAQITVEECGIYGYGGIDPAATVYLLLCRDLTGSQAIADGGGITITYTVSVTV